MREFILSICLDTFPGGGEKAVTKLMDFGFAAGCGSVLVPVGGLVAGDR